MVETWSATSPLKLTTTWCNNLGIIPAIGFIRLSEEAEKKFYEYWSVAIEKDLYIKLRRVKSKNKSFLFSFLVFFSSCLTCVYMFWLSINLKIQLFGHVRFLRCPAYIIVSSAYFWSPNIFKKSTRLGTKIFHEYDKDKISQGIERQSHTPVDFTRTRYTKNCQHESSQKNAH